MVPNGQNGINFEDAPFSSIHKKIGSGHLHGADLRRVYSRHCRYCPVLCYRGAGTGQLLDGIDRSRSSFRNPAWKPVDRNHY